ncbi:Protein CBG27635 [Caenorhabditis briggsae]|uniref:Protein CBG27635 n=1 Tax=Caenorhabditis briggsae TaxID=6238 RepID=B6IJ80_CAEBR|nr:Protein CBG27635 [Caenorhabditis briggsae]CAR99914.1 Protein CBG27635 [Caenorhabditis briggsae]
MRIVILLALFALGCLAADHEKSLQFDVVFLIDGSQTARPVFDNVWFCSDSISLIEGFQFTNFVGDLMAPYNVSMSGARIGIIVVAADLDDQPPPAANLNYIPA